MGRINQYKKVAASASKAFIMASTIRKQAPILIPTTEKFLVFYKEEMKYLEHMRYEFFALKNWSNERFTKVTGEWNKFNRKIFTKWQNYKFMPQFLFFLDGIVSTGVIEKPTNEWVAPGLRAIDHLRGKIAKLESMCLYYQTLVNGTLFDADVEFIHEMRERLSLDLNALRPSAESDEGWDNYWKKSHELHTKIAKKEETLRIRSIYSENRYVSEYQDIYYIPAGSSWWQKFWIINFGTPVTRVRVRNKREPFTIFAAAAMFLLLLCGFGIPATIAYAVHDDDKKIRKEIIEAQNELSNLVYVGSKKPAYFIYKYIGQWSYILSNLEKALVDTNKHLSKLVKVYPEKLSDIDATLVSLRRIFKTQGVLSASQVSTVKELTKSLKDNWDFDLVLPALSIQGGDRIGCIKVEEPEWHAVEKAADGLVPS
ncbi:hypothetical protein PHO31112_05320 [Pandoraea horticolens]|uniref:Uncharacterized protein n=1 Tax=Pandoraea horticolens TaxID=2508298 RepID=A0A5E4ZB28_9BURK|nr:hypothetical protein [Pandoraea horticolens]VVE58449.1 hypothetical protein PHO31112_05320 [Pandoraea horticolens]